MGSLRFCAGNPAVANGPASFPGSPNAAPLRAAQSACSASPAALSAALESIASYLGTLLPSRESVPVLKRPTYRTGFIKAFTVYGGDEFQARNEIAVRPWFSV